jgi:hypothetical protein
MPSLRELQIGFVEAVFGTTDTGFGALIRDNGLTGARRLQVYRNNTFTSLTEALAAIYPVVQQLVGEGFFRYAAHQYIRRYPSTSGNLHDFGGEFAGLLGTLPQAAQLAYLPEVARLEWAWHQVFHEGEGADGGRGKDGGPPLDLSALAGVPPDRYGELRFRLHPASRLLASPYPVLRIWQVNQAGYAGEAIVDLAEGGVRLLVIRRGLEVELEPLSPGEFVLLDALAKDQAFGHACEAAIAAEPPLDLTACLQHHVLQGTLVDFHLTPGSSRASDRSLNAGKGWG